MSLLSRIEKSQKTTGGLSKGVRKRRGSTSKKGKDAFRGIKERVQNKLISELEPGQEIKASDEMRRKMEDMFNTVLASESIILSRTERQKMFEQVVAEILGFGPIEVLLQEEAISEIMVNGPKMVYVEKKGKLLLSDVTFDSNAHVMQVIDRIVSPLGRRVDESSPLVDARLPDGSRVNAIIPPLALDGPTLTIRKFEKDPLTIHNLVAFGSITPMGAEFLEAAVVGRANIVVAGGTGSGKTTLLNVSSNFIPDGERIITVENAAELQIAKDHVVRLESRPPNIEGKGEITINDLIINTLRMRPDRVVVGECRGGEALAMLQAMNTGHDGSLTTAHANTPRDTIARLETMCLMAGMDLPVSAIRKQIAGAVDLIIQQARLGDGSRRILNITEIQGMEGDNVVLADIFVFNQTAIENGKIKGEFVATGVVPNILKRITDHGIDISPDFFRKGRTA
ncbi:MAG: type II secretion system protein E [Anaerolineaceae bacterium 4572_78]|nr:MAG: type II secretion system protein E [Anaerolineaceae bacterium 4572_78]